MNIHLYHLNTYKIYINIPLKTFCANSGFCIILGGFSIGVRSVSSKSLEIPPFTIKFFEREFAVTDFYCRIPSREVLSVQDPIVKQESKIVLLITREFPLIICLSGQKLYHICSFQNKEGFIYEKHFL